MRSALNRVGAVLAVATGMAVVAVVFSLLMDLSQKIAPDWLPYRLAGGGFEKDIVQRIEAAEAFYKESQGRDDRYLCALIGLSGMREAGDLKAMTALGNNQCRYIGLSGAGGALDTMATQTRRLIDGSLRPDVAVIGVGEFLLIKPVSSTPGITKDARRSLAWSEALRHGDVRQLAKLFKDGLWFIERRRDLNGLAEELMVGAKQHMLRLFGASRSASSNPLLDPWREMIRMEVPEHPSATALRAGIASYQTRGAYEPASYAPERIAEQTQALNTVVRRLRERGTVVLLAVMPEHSELRSRSPETGVQALRSGLAQAFGADAPPIVDLRASVPDSGFTDLTHVNKEGRQIVSKLLSEQVVHALPQGRKPLMAVAATGH